MPEEPSNDESGRSNRSLRLSWRVRGGRRRPSNGTIATAASTSSRGSTNGTGDDEIHISTVVPTLPRGVAPRIDGAERELLEAHHRRSQRKIRAASLRRNIEEQAERDRSEKKDASADSSREGRKELKDLKRKVAKLQRENNSLDDRARTLGSSLGEARESLSRASEEAKAQEAKCTEYGAAMVESLKEVGRVRLAARDERTALLEKHAAEKRARETAEERIRELEDKKSRASDELLQDLSEEHNSEATARRDAEARCLEIEDRLKESEASHRELTERHGEVATARDTAEARCGALEEKLAASLQKNQEFAALLRQKQSKIESMDRSLDELEKLRELKLDYEDAVARCLELEEEAAEAAASHEELEEENRALSREIADFHGSAFDAEDERKVKAEELRKRIAALEAECRLLATERDSAKKSNRAISRENESLVQQTARLQSCLARIETEGTDRIRELRLSNETLTGRCEALETELETRTQKQLSELEYLAEELRKTRTETESLATRFTSSADLPKNPLRGETSEDEAVGEGLRKSLESLVGRCTQLETELQQMKEGTVSKSSAAAKEPGTTANDTGSLTHDALATELTTIEEEMRQDHDRTVTE